MSQQSHYLSTTALANKLQKEAREVFQLLARAHWMVKVDDRWSLTEKGRFEGGIYQQHPKFGDYVAWPESVKDHPIWRGLPDAPLSATQLGHHFRLPARLINLVLADLGWQKRGLKGWQLTDFGRLHGGEQKRAEHSNVPYVTWPELIRDDEQLNRRVSAMASEQGLDGRHYPDRRQADVANWLYLHGFSTSVGRWLSTAPGPVSFWLPGVGLIIHVFDKAAGPQDIKLQLEMADWLKRQVAILVPDSLAEGIGALDEWLPGQLLLQGIDNHA